MITRRSFLEVAGLGTIVAGSAPAFLSATAAEAAARGELGVSPLLPSGTRSGAILDTLPGKRPLIKLSYEPPNYETPLEYFRSTITPNEAFFVRYHHARIPELDAGSWKLRVGGAGADRAIAIGFDELRRFPAFEVTAVCQSSGNRRGLFRPHVPGVEWGYGAMGCARWKGARLKDVLHQVGVKKEAVEIVFDGADTPRSNETPDYIKSLPVWKALEETTLLAYEMNGTPLPHWNGFPVRLVVPGWTGTYWIKHLTSIAVATKPFDGFWMKSAYRIPNGKFPAVPRFISQETAVDAAISEMVVNSLITAPADGAPVKTGIPVTVRGIAWDAGHGIRMVEVSHDGGNSWAAATLGEDAGRFAFREWTYALLPGTRGKHVIMARATNRLGQSQTSELVLNPEGFHHNVIQALTLIAT